VRPAPRVHIDRLALARYRQWILVMSAFLGMLAIYAGSHEIWLARFLSGRHLLGLGSLLAADDDEARVYPRNDGLLTNTLLLLDSHRRTSCARSHLPLHMLRRLFASELLLMRWTPYLVRMPSMFLRRLAVSKVRVLQYYLLPAGLNVPTCISSGQCAPWRALVALMYKVAA
jgi:hypothetical protein